MGLDGVTLPPLPAPINPTPWSPWGKPSWSAMLVSPLHRVSGIFKATAPSKCGPSPRMIYFITAAPVLSKIYFGPVRRCGTPSLFVCLTSTSVRLHGARSRAFQLAMNFVWQVCVSTSASVQRVPRSSWASFWSTPPFWANSLTQKFLYFIIWILLSSL